MLRDITRSQLIRLFSTRITDIRLCRFCCTVTNGFIEKKGHTGRGVLAMRSFTILDFIEDRRRNNYLIKIRNPWSRTTTTQTNTSKSTEKILQNGNTFPQDFEELFKKSRMVPSYWE
nr:unnamed protein product [Meloidogyne enterolobii]